MKQPKISTVIVNWKGWQDTIDCIASLKKINYKNHEIIIVDNGSPNESVEKLSKIKGIKFFPMEKNLGFAGGQNYGMQKALEFGADYIFPLNNDTTVDPELFNHLLTAFKDPSAGASAPRIYYFTEPKTIWWTGGFLDLDHGIITNIQTHNLALFPKGGTCDYICGCAILIKREVLEKVGMFAEEYFHTAEDVDLSLRITRAGYKLYVVPRAKIWHKVSASGGGDTSPFYLYYIERNRLWLVKKYGHWSSLTWLRISPILAKRLAAAAVKGRKVAAVLAVFRAWSDFRKGKLGKVV